MILINQEGNKSIKVEESISKIMIEYSFDDMVLAKLSNANSLWRLNNMFNMNFGPFRNSYKNKKEYEKALSKHKEDEAIREKEKEECNIQIGIDREELYKSQEYYKIIVDDTTYAMYKNKDKAYEIFAEMFKAYGNDNKVYTFAKDELQK